MLAVASGPDTGTHQQKPPETVKQVNLERYTGLWYEIARLPNRFQKKCAGETTADYSLREDGKITVVNECKKLDGKIDRIKGIAKVVDKNTNARLKVSFFSLLGFSLFWGDYWIIGLDDNYRWAIIGSPNRKYGWILAREPHLGSEQLQYIYQILEKQGYNPGEFQMTPQVSNNKSSPESTH